MVLIGIVVRENQLDLQKQKNYICLIVTSKIHHMWAILISVQSG